MKKINKHLRKVKKHLRKIEKYCIKHSLDLGHIRKINASLHDLGLEIDQYT